MSFFNDEPRKFIFEKEDKTTTGYRMLYTYRYIVGCCFFSLKGFPRTYH